MPLPRFVIGAGPPTVVVLSGGNAFISRFDETRARRDAGRLQRLFPGGTRLCVVGYAPDGSGPVDVASLASEVASLIETEFPGAALAGMSFGGLVALQVAVDRPDLVDHLILLATAYRFSDAGRQRVRSQMAALAADDIDAMARPFLSLFRRPWMNRLARLLFPLKRRAILRSLNPPATSMAMLQSALDASGALSARLRTIQTKTLLIAGTRDQFFDIHAMREMAAVMPVMTLTLLDGETHMLPIERAKDVAIATSAFLRS